MRSPRELVMTRLHFLNCAITLLVTAPSNGLSPLPFCCKKPLSILTLCPESLSLSNSHADLRLNLNLNLEGFPSSAAKDKIR
ncbi:hypothetical protein B0J13DRAFT_554788 [Dactylonectria estremocensis]|uniref:Secreted protein n=1 Tax=Dactylonectria estremocensis TaxID=1079267 RepID=A0A9P9ETK1_9HYPO|nr:hypothetical protein B0J13DRAFT_554788 [Dactylonectria estremocensis]